MSKGSRLKKKCSCGSGKKARDCCLGKRPRSEQISFTMNTAEAINGISMSKDGKIELLKDGKPIQPLEMFKSTSYKKQNGRERCISRVPLTVSKNLSFEETIHDYDLLFAVDTNTKESSKHDIKSITSIVETKIEKKTQSNEVIHNILIYFQTFFATKEKKEKVENEGWVQAIRYIAQKYPEEFSSKKIGIVVDSDLKFLNQYNSGELPIVEDKYLPENITLIFASSSTSKDTIYNHLIADADDLSNKFFQQLEEGKSDQEIVHYFIHKTF
jgi:hypothetical protein